jgi:HlyD family secretion protein
MTTTVEKPRAPTGAPPIGPAARPSPATAAGNSPLWRRHPLWGLAIGAALVVAAFVWWRNAFGPVTVSLAPVQQNVREQVFGLGVVGARIQSNVGFKISGVLAELDADQGDRVRVGQVLARLDARDVAAQLAVAKANVAQAQANIGKANGELASATAALANASSVSGRDAGLIASGVVSREQAEADQAAVRVGNANVAVARSGIGQAVAALQSARAQEAFAEATLENYTLRAPYDAWIASRNLELGSSPNGGQAVFSLVAANTVWVQGYVDERLAGRLRVGQPARITLRSSPSTLLPGRVARIEIQSDPVNEERLVDVTFDQVPQNIHLAEQAEVVVTTGVLPRAVVIQPKAVTDLRDGRGTVWTLEQGRLRRRAVAFGPELLDGRLPLVDGLPSDAAVVATPVAGLRVGRAAHVARSSRP